jgi:hypothetical protein
VRLTLPLRSGMHEDFFYALPSKYAFVRETKVHQRQHYDKLKKKTVSGPLVWDILFVPDY